MTQLSAVAAGALRALRGLGPIDLKSVRRDSLLGWMLLIPLLIGLLYRYGVPPTGAWLERFFDVVALE